MPYILAFSGQSNSGKTTFLSKTVALLSSRGLRVGVIKHHGHKTIPLHPKGKDSHTFLDSGAALVALTGSGQTILYPAETGQPELYVAAAQMKNRVDIVLAEGYKYESVYKIEVVAPDKKPQLIDDPLLLGLVRRNFEQSEMKDSGVRTFNSDNPEAAADFIQNCFCPADRPGQLPDKEDCFSLMARYGMLPNIFIHSLVVNEVAKRLASALIRSGHVLDLPMVEAGSLLHDIAKTECLKEKCMHGERGYEILRDLGYPYLGEVVRDHIDPENATKEKGYISPSLVVNYADKRVLHDSVVPIEIRAEDLVERYGNTPKRNIFMKKLVEMSLKLEGKLFEYINNFKPEDLIAVNETFKRVQKNSFDI